MEAVLAKDSARTSRAAWLWEARDHPGRFHASMSRFLRRLRGPSRVTHMLLLLHWKVGWERELSWGENKEREIFAAFSTFVLFLHSLASPEEVWKDCEEKGKHSPDA